MFELLKFRQLFSFRPGLLHRHLCCRRLGAEANHHKIDSLGYLAMQVSSSSNNLISDIMKSYAVDLIIVNIPNGSPIPWKMKFDKHNIP